MVVEPEGMMAQASIGGHIPTTCCDQGATQIKSFHEPMMLFSYP